MKQAEILTIAEVGDLGELSKSTVGYYTPSRDYFNPLFKTVEDQDKFKQALKLKCSGWYVNEDKDYFVYRNFLTNTAFGFKGQKYFYKRRDISQFKQTEYLDFSAGDKKLKEDRYWDGHHIIQLMKLFYNETILNGFEDAYMFWFDGLNIMCGFEVIFSDGVWKPIVDDTVEGFWRKRTFKEVLTRWWKLYNNYHVFTDIENKIRYGFYSSYFYEDSPDNTIDKKLSTQIDVIDLTKRFRRELKVKSNEELVMKEGEMKSGNKVLWKDGKFIN